MRNSLRTLSTQVGSWYFLFKYYVIVVLPNQIFRAGRESKSLHQTIQSNELQCNKTNNHCFQYIVRAWHHIIIHLTDSEKTIINATFESSKTHRAGLDHLFLINELLSCFKKKKRKKLFAYSSSTTIRRHVIIIMMYSKSKEKFTWTTWPHNWNLIV